jgi:hypothetical protein
VANGVLAFLAGAGAGYMKQRDLEDERAYRNEERGFQREQRDRARKQWGEEDQLQAGLKAAAAPVALTEGSGGMVRPDTMDNRDVGLPENAEQPNAGLVPMAYRVGSTGYADRAAADAAVSAANKPEAVTRRVADAYRNAGQVDKALQIDSNARTAEVQQLQLADARWKRDLAGAMRAGHGGLAQLATNSEAGPLAGKKVQLIPSADGKSISYGVEGPDGKVVPVPGMPSFSNDERGVTQAAWMLDRTITPEARLTHYQGEEDRTLKQSNNERDYKLREREADSRIELRGAQAENMALRASLAADRAAGGGKGGAGELASFDPLGDFDAKQARKGAMDQALEEAKNNPGKDGKPPSEAQIAARAQAIYAGLRDAAATDNTNRHVQSTVAGAFRKAGSDPEAYAETYAKALNVANAQQLTAWGYRAPGGNAAAAVPGRAQVAAGGVPRSGEVAPPRTAPPAPPSDPTELAGQRLDAARTTLAALRQRKPPGLAAGREAIDAFAAEVEAARQAVRQAEGEYQRAVPASGAAFVYPSTR